MKILIEMIVGFTSCVEYMIKSLGYAANEVIDIPEARVKYSPLLAALKSGKTE